MCRQELQNQWRRETSVLKRGEGRASQHRRDGAGLGLPSAINHGETWPRDVGKEQTPPEDGQHGPRLATARRWHWPSGQELPSPGQAPAWAAALCPGGDGGLHVLFSTVFSLSVNCDYYKMAHPCHTAPEAVQTRDRKKLSALKSLQPQALPLRGRKEAASGYTGARHHFAKWETSKSSSLNNKDFLLQPVPSRKMDMVNSMDDKSVF